MSDRITSAMISSSVLGDINSSLSAMERSESELASGKSILEPSDNPYGASHAIELQSQLDGLSSYTSSVQDGITLENTASSALANINDLTQRARELVVQSSNGTYNQSDRENIASEIEQLTEGVKQDANTQYAGQYIFSGTLTGTAPYQEGSTDTYKGNSGSISRAIGPSSSVNVSTNISSLLGNGQASSDGKLLDTLRTISEQLRGGTPEDLNTLRTSAVKNLEANLETLSGLQANVGSVTDQLQAASTRIEDFQETITSALSNTENVDFAQVSIKYANQQAAYDAALRAGANIVQESLLNFLQ
jgi:flagellar hook-associated protein 3 FlgL